MQLCVIGKGGNRDPISMKDRKSLFIFVASKGYMYSYIDANTNREESKKQLGAINFLKTKQKKKNSEVAGGYLVKNVLWSFCVLDY